MELKREFTIKLRFGSQSRNPSNNEIFKFFRKQNWSCEELSAMYREDYSLFVRFLSRELMENALIKLGPTTKFDYDDGTTLEVSVSAATGIFKYIRIFGLPPEVEDKQIAATLSKYGVIQQMLRERYSIESGFPIWSGVRGVHMEVKAEIPAQLNIQNIKARIYYDGLQNKCFICGALDHFKVECPKRKTVNERMSPSYGKVQNEMNYANVVRYGETHGNSQIGKENISADLDNIFEESTTRMQTEDSSNEQLPNLEATVTEEATADEDATSIAEVFTVGECSSVMEDVVLYAEKSKKRGRKEKLKVDSDNSESDSVEKKKLIVPATFKDVIREQGRRSRSTNKAQRSLSNGPRTSTWSRYKRV